MLSVEHGLVASMSRYGRPHRVIRAVFVNRLDKFFARGRTGQSPAHVNPFVKPLRKK